MMLIDSFLPEGITRLAVDSIFMMPQLGVLAEVHPEAATEVFEKDCLIWLGTCVAARAATKPGRPIFSAELTRADGSRESHELLLGDLVLLPLGLGETVKAKLEPAKGADLGWGPGKTVEKELHGGVVGLILDGRGRPIVLDPDDPERVAKIRRWTDALEAYPDSKSEPVAVA
jgi:hypothetical protein